MHSRFSKTDIVGLLLDLPKKTIGLYMNGAKSKGALTLPDALFEEDGSLKEALFPTVVVKSSVVEVNNI